MDSLRENFASYLLELQGAARNINAKNYKETVHKYDIVFMGENFSRVSSIEVGHSFCDKYGLTLGQDEINLLVTSACSRLKMGTEGMVLLEDAKKKDRPINSYIINLF